MAVFTFFRRRQKLVIIVMVLLMVAFAIGGLGFQMLVREDPRKKVIGRTAEGELTHGQLAIARDDLELLQSLGLGAAGTIGDVAFRRVLENQDRRVWTYTLLRDEADRSGIRVLESEVEEFFREHGMEVGSPHYDAVISQIRTIQRIPAEQVHAVVARWLAVFGTFRQARVNTSPSEQEMRHLHRRLSEGISLRVLKISTGEFVKKVRNPNADEIRNQFNNYRGMPPGIRSDLPLESMGFGYRQPPRVKVQYLFVARSAISRVVRPDEKEMIEHWDEHKDEFTKEIPVEAPATQPASSPATLPAGSASTQPATGPATRPTTQPVRHITVRKSYAEAREEVRAALQDRAVQTAVSDVLGRAKELLADFKKQPESERKGGNPFEWVRSRMVRPAAGKLAVTRSVRIRNSTLAEAVEELNGVFDVRICFPWGTHGRKTWDPAIRVTLAGKDGEAVTLTLGEALERIAGQVTDMPTLKWAACDGLTNAIFPVSGIDFFPISVNQTAMMDDEQMQADELLGNCYTSAALGKGRPLADIAFKAKELVGEKGLIVRGQVSIDEMYAHGYERGRLIWRLVEAKPSHVLHEIQEPGELSGELLEQVTGDLKTKFAFAEARKQAAEVLKAAEEVGLEQAAKKRADDILDGVAEDKHEELDRKLQTTVTGLFARSVDYTRYGLGIRPSFVRDVPLQSAAVYEHFMKKVFALAPKDVEPPYPDKPYALAVVALPAGREVLVVQRVEYMPLVESVYNTWGRSRAAGLLYVEHIRRDLSSWFYYDRVVERTGFHHMERE